jgi:hypothetical protein
MADIREGAHDEETVEAGKDTPDPGRVTIEEHGTPPEG